MKGIDVSRYQGRIDFRRVKRAGVDFIILRAGYGRILDSRFRRNARLCRRYGIPAGVYWFSYALSAEDARREARQCLRTIRKYRISWPVCYDLEYASVAYARSRGVVITRSLATRMAQAFLGEIERQGYYAMLYSNQDYLNRMFEPGLLKRYDLWYAWYEPRLNRTDVGIWQFGDKGRVPGIRGYVDVDRSERDYEAIIKRAGLNRL